MPRPKKTPDPGAVIAGDSYIIPFEVESRLGISASTRRRWTRRGLLRAYPLGPNYQPGASNNREGNGNGSRVRYSEAEVVDLMGRIKRGELARSLKPADL
jgi:hypothetical protein